jgi:serine/threonine protein kinase
MAPEIYVNEEYVGTKVDIFACGIILFIMIFGKPPFFKADHRDPFYKFFVNKNPTGFWEIYEEKVTKGIKIDPDLKEILSSIFNFDPEERPDWETILGFAWMRKDVMDRDIMLNEMNAKRDLLVSKKKG